MPTVTAQNNIMINDPLARAISIVSSIFGTGSASQVTYVNGFETLTIHGSFSNFNADGDPTSGTITSFDYTMQGSGTISVSGLSLSVPTVFGWIFTNNIGALNNAVFGGADTITGIGADDVLIGYGGD